jgi:hypothetical protein
VRSRPCNLTVQPLYFTCAQGAALKHAVPSLAGRLDGYVDGARRTLSVEKGGIVVGKVEDVPEGYTVLYRPWITLRNGKRLYAAAYGLTAFRLVVRK